MKLLWFHIAKYHLSSVFSVTQAQGDLSHTCIDSRHFHLVRAKVWGVWTGNILSTQNWHSVWVWWAYSRLCMILYSPLPPRQHRHRPCCHRGRGRHIYITISSWYKLWPKRMQYFLVCAINIVIIADLEGKLDIMCLWGICQHALSFAITERGVYEGSVFLVLVLTI